uniref:Uncharacterized protein n=1 Tax=Romanomermis culicivorax TaxID=13658 RepID=A0A915J0P2_ROMCU
MKKTGAGFIKETKDPFILHARVGAYANEIRKKCARKSASQMLSLEQREHLEQKREHCMLFLLIDEKLTC